MPFLTTIGGGSAKGFGRGRPKLGLGSSAANPAINANAILAENPNAPDGVYYFKDPNGSNTVYSTYCIMQKYGGGWMKAVQYYNNTAVGSTSAAINAGGNWTTAEVNNGAGKLQNADLNRITGTECLMRVNGGTDTLFNSGAGTAKLRYRDTLPNWGTSVDVNSTTGTGYNLELDTTSNGSLDYDVVYQYDSQGLCNHTTSYWLVDHNYNHYSGAGLAPPFSSYSICWTFGNSAVYTNLHWMSGQSSQSGGAISWGNDTSSFAIFLRPTPNPGYTLRGILMDWDPAKLNLGSDLTTIANGTNLGAGLSEHSQNGINIRVNNGSFHWRTGQGGHIDSSSGNNGRISVDGVFIEKSLDGSRSMTLSCWFQSTGGGRYVLLSRYGTGYNNQFNHIVDPNGSFHSNCGGLIGDSGTNYSTGHWSNNTWHLCHWTYNHTTGQAKHWINGVEVINTNRNTNGLNSSSNSGFGIMARADDYERLIGRLGRVRVHSVALTSAEIAAEWANERGIYGV